jgi:pimeloyl-ACP methyl ester carboxylesterase
VAFFTAPDGVRLHYEVEGAGPPLVFHLGAGCDATLWKEAGYVDPLSKANTCILFDHRGHGPSDHPTAAEAHGIDHYAGDVAALADHLGYTSVSFFGWSNAVPVGIRVAQLRPSLFDRMVLFGAVGRRASAEQITLGTAARVEAIRARGWRSILDDMEAAEKYPVPRWFIERVEATDVAPWLAFTEARPSWNWSIWDAAPGVETPTLLIAGELEDPDDVVGELAVQMPRATRVRVPEREHINAFLDSEYVAPLVMDFLAARPSTAHRPPPR